MYYTYSLSEKGEIVLFPPEDLLKVLEGPLKARFKILLIRLT